MIINDWSQLTIAAASAFGEDFKKGRDTSKMIDIMRHTVLNTLRSYKVKYGKEYGDLVLAIDGRHYWRKDIFQYYKAGRKEGREASDIDWKSIFDISAQLRDEFAEVFPYKFVKENSAEADDVIGVLTKYLQSEELVESSFSSDPQDILIISSDHDYKQLHKYKGVRQWCPRLKKFVTKAEKHFLLLKILTGDPGDGIPNVRSPDNILTIEGSRQAPITAAIKQKACDQVDAGGKVTFPDALTQTRFRRNQILIDFDEIPVDVSTKIMDSYVSQKDKVMNRGNIFNYLVKNRCTRLLTDIQGF